MWTVVPCFQDTRHLSGLALDRGRLSAATHPVATEGIRHYVADGSTAAASG
jgi:hypothetical protein